MSEDTKLDESKNGVATAFDLTTATVEQPTQIVVDTKAFDSPEDARTWIFSVNDLLERVVHVPEWNMDILLVGLTASERNAVITTSTDMQTGIPNMDKLYTGLIIKSARHPISREKIFHPADRDALNQRSGKVIDQLATVVTELSGMKKDDVEQAEKNSNGIQS